MAERRPTARKYREIPDRREVKDDRLNQSRKRQAIESPLKQLLHLPFTLSPPCGHGTGPFLS